MKTIGRKISGHLPAFTSAMLLAGSPAWAGPTLNVYGPGGPAPAIEEAAKAFGAVQNIEANVTASRHLNGSRQQDRQYSPGEVGRHAESPLHFFY